MPLAVRKRYEQMPESDTKQALIKNFDEACLHPDQADIHKLKLVLKNII